MKLISICMCLSINVAHCFASNTRSELKMNAENETRDSHEPGRQPGSNAFAVVPYEEQSVLEIHKHNRSLRFGPHTIEIRQNWQSGGVAAVVWDAAIVLAEYLVQHSTLVRDKNVIELGAGTGLAGIMASKLGANVTFTDRLNALDYLNDNVQLNIKGNVPPVRVAELDWGEPLQGFAAPFDVILGADIVYIEDTFEDLLRTIQNLSDCKTVIYLSCRIRYERDERFLNMLQGAFHVTKTHYDQQRDIVLYLAKKKCKEDL